MCLIMGYTHVYPRNGAAIFGKIRNHLQQIQAYTHIDIYIYINHIFIQYKYIKYAKYNS